MNSAAAARCGCDPAEGVFFGCPSVESGPPFVGTWGEGEPRGANPFARAPCREAFAVESVPGRGKSFRSCAVSGGFRRGERFCAGQILSLVRRVGKPSPRGVFSRGDKFFRSCAVSGGFRRGEPSRVGANSAHHPAPSEPHPAVRVDLRAGRVQRAASAGEAAPVSVSQKRSSSSRSASASSPPAKTRARAWSTLYCAYVQHRAARESSSSASA